MQNKILVVTPTNKINYAKVYPAIIRAIDLVASDTTQGVDFIVDGVLKGTTSLVIEAINKIEASLKGYGYNVAYKTRKLDVMLYGLKNAHRKWVEIQMKKDPDCVVVFPGEGVDVAHVKRLAKENNVMVIVQ